MVGNYVITEFRMDFSPSVNGASRSGIIHCQRLSEDEWRIGIKPNKPKENYSLYEMAEAIKDIFTQEQHEIATVFLRTSEEAIPIVVSKATTVESVLEQLARKITP